MFLYIILIEYFILFDVLLQQPGNQGNNSFKIEKTIHGYESTARINFICADDQRWSPHKPQSQLTSGS